MLGELIPCGGGDPIPLLKEKLLVGRRSDCDVTIPFRSVSSRHCELEWTDGCWVLRDLSSRNGTAVNGIRYDETRLMPNDVVSFARQRYSILYTRPKSSSTQDHSAAPVSERKPSRPHIDREPGNSRASRSPPPPAGGLLGRLVPCGGGDPIPLWEPVLVVGRRSRCDIQLQFTTISSQHCKLEFKSGYWFVQDLNSTNGIKIDGVRNESGWLLPESVLSIAKERYQIFYTPSGDGPPPEEDPFAKSLLEKAGLTNQFDSGRTPKWLRQRDDDLPRKKWTLEDDE